MKHNILWLLFVVGVVGSGTFTACTDYTDDIESPRASQDTEVGGGSNVLPPELLNPNQGVFSEEKMLVNIGLNVISKNVDDFYIETRRLKRDIGERCTKLKAGVNETSHLVRVQEQWKKTMLAYHRLDAAPIGPLSDNSGKLASEIYSWPFINSCGLDLEVARINTASASKDLAISKKGLGALEYLLYADASKTVCANSFLNKDATEWIKKDDVTKSKDRCDFSMRVAEDLEIQAKTLFSFWDVSQKNFTKALIDGSRYKSNKEAINAMTDAMFAIEVIKDTKLGVPLGLVSGCNDVSGLCPSQTEHILSGLALESIEAQVQAFKEVFFGSSDPSVKAFGFDDYLIVRGHSAVVDEFVQELSIVETSVLKAQSIGVLKDLVTTTDKASCTMINDRTLLQPACQLFFDVRKLTNLLKTDLLPVLSLEMPATFQGDND